MPGLIRHPLAPIDGWDTKPQWPYVLNMDSELTQGLVGWWPGDPGNGQKLWDLSGNGSHTVTGGTIPSGGVWAPAKDGGRSAIAYDGTTNFAAVTTPQKFPNISAAKAVSCWIYYNTVPGAAQTIWAANKDDTAGSNNAIDLEIGRSGLGNLAISTWGGTNVLQLTAPAVKVWHNVTYSVINPATAAGSVLWVDGKNLGTGGGTTPQTGTIGVFDVGRFNTAFPGLFTGLVSDVVFWNRALTNAEIFSLYDPATRWSLRYQTGRKKYFIQSAVVATGIAFDAASNSGYQAAASTYTWNHTCTGTNRFLGVDISLLSTGNTVTSITYNGVALSLIPGASKSTVTSLGRIECWGLANPASGTNVISVTLSGSIISVGTAVSYTGVHQTSPVEAGNAAQATNVGAADAQVAITTVADNDWVHAAIVTDDTSVTANQTTRNNVTGAGGSGADEDTGPITPAASTTMSYTGVGALATWAIAGYAIRPIAASNLTGLFRVGNLDGLGTGGNFFTNPLGS